MSEVTLDSPVTVLGGVGAVRAAAYAKAGVETLGDLIYHIPRAYENRGDIRPLREARRDGGKTALVLTVATEPRAARLPRRMTILKFRACDETDAAEVTFFNQDYLKSKFTLGSVWRFYGVVEVKGRGSRYSLTSPAFEPWEEGRLPDFTAVYPLSEGLSQKQLAQNVAEAMRLCAHRINDPLPEEIRCENDLPTLGYALRNIHLPESYTALAAAKRRLVFDELFFFALGLAGRKKRDRTPGALPCTKQNISPLLALLPYELTGAQKRAISEIAADMRSDIPMNRMVVGDVGCGKTVVAAAAILIAVMSGHQAALMAPTEILARQHYAELAPMLERLGIRTALLVGATPAAEKRKIKASLANISPDMRLEVVIGTHALISDGVEFSDLALAVTDEQHRFGVAQRAALAAGAEHAHVLAMSATPIPRSLALTIYGDLDISKIDEMPPGRQKVDTFAVDESYRARLLAFIEKNVREGGQVYIVCPSIEENAEADSGEVGIDDIAEGGFEEKPPLKAAATYAEELAAALPDIRVSLVHGRMKPGEKDAAMRAFAAGESDVLVSTTVIEVGVNVPNASLMIVENAERFGLSQLHQLRGRVGRGSRKSYCILVSDSKSENARRRLGVLTKTNNGFEIAEEDLAMRGPGDFFGKRDGDVRQSGGVRFRFADLCGDAGLLAAATGAAHRILADDPQLTDHPVLRSEVMKMFGEDE